MKEKAAQRQSISSVTHIVMSVLERMYITLPSGICAMGGGKSP